jgi:uncharacterized membrane protein
MAAITVWVDIDASAADVWREAADLASHGEWMADVESLRFLDDRRSGPGTRMEVATVVGPLKTTDLLTVTDWVEGRAIGVEHSGLVKGRGRFEVSPIAGGTRFLWTEELTFPLLLGGPVTAFFARPVLRGIWRRNLRRLRERIEGR